MQQLAGYLQVPPDRPQTCDECVLLVRGHRSPSQQPHEHQRERDGSRGQQRQHDPVGGGSLGNVVRRGHSISRLTTYMRGSGGQPGQHAQADQREQDNNAHGDSYRPFAR